MKEHVILVERTETSSVFYKVKAETHKLAVAVLEDAWEAKDAEQELMSRQLDNGVGGSEIKCVRTDYEPDSSHYTLPSNKD